jgi:hypothetical protein
METEVAQDDLLHRDSSGCERVVSAGAEGAHGGLLTMSDGGVPGAMSATVVADKTFRLSYG